MHTAEIAAIIDRWKLNGLVIGTLRNGAISCQVFGVRDLETRKPVTEETVFGIGSISKVFTATLAMRLVDAGKLDLDTPIVSYYPQLSLSDAARPNNASATPSAGVATNGAVFVPAAMRASPGSTTATKPPSPLWLL